MSKQATERYRKTVKGILTNTFHKQRERAMNYGFPPPNYTLNELHDRFLHDVKFLALYDAWVSNGYMKPDKPSLDRTDPTRGYSLDNISVMTWSENRKKGDAEKILTRRTQVFQLDANGSVIAFYDSIQAAAKATKCYQGNITSCCRGQRHCAGGFAWRYGEKRRCKKDRIGNIHQNPELLDKKR